MRDGKDAQRARRIAGEHVPAPGASMAYGSPEAVQADETLSPAQKRRFLTAWRRVLADHLAGREITSTDADGEAELVARIDRVLEMLAAV